MSFDIENCKVVYRTQTQDKPMALLVKSDYFEHPEWIPYSCVDGDSEVYRVGDTGTLKVHDWFADKKGWL